jgi:hypothetical protein
MMADTLAPYCVARYLKRYPAALIALAHSSEWGSVWRLEYRRQQFHRDGGTHQAKHVEWIAVDPAGQFVAQRTRKGDAIEALADEAELRRAV